MQGKFETLVIRFVAVFVLVFIASIVFLVSYHWEEIYDPDWSSVDCQ